MESDLHHSLQTYIEAEDAKLRSLRSVARNLRKTSFGKEGRGSMLGQPLGAYVFLSNFKQKWKRVRELMKTQKEAEGELFNN